MHEEIKKVIYKCLSNLSPGKVLPYVDLDVEFQDSTNERLLDHAPELEEVAASLEEKKYAIFENIGRGMFIVKKGIHFDEWERQLNSESYSKYNVTVSGSQNFQVGHDNVQNINVTPQEFVDALNKLLENPEQNKSIIDRLNQMVQSGANVTSLVSTLASVF